MKDKVEVTVWLEGPGWTAKELLGNLDVPKEWQRKIPEANIPYRISVERIKPPKAKP